MGIRKIWLLGTICLSILFIQFIAFDFYRGKNTAFAFEGTSCQDVTGGLIGKDECKDEDVIINGNVDIEGVHSFKNLTIKSGAILSHPALEREDLSNSAVIDAKKIDLKIASKLTMEPNSQIDVSGRGYWYWPWMGTMQGGGPPGKKVGGGGSGAGGGNGGRGGANPNLDNVGFSYYFDDYGQAILTYDTSLQSYHGGSGGYVPHQGNGGKGGGVIKIETKNMQLASTAHIKANGEEGAGGGAGGFISLKVFQQYDPISAIFGKVKISGGNNNASDGRVKGEEGVAPVDEFYGGGNFEANGGKGTYSGFVLSGGGGGGGIIKVEFGQIIGSDNNVNVCKNLGVRDYIPAICEGEDVVISAGKIVYADKIRMKESIGECDNPNDSLCDSKRTFQSLTILGEPPPPGGAGIGKLTHEAISRFEAAAEDTNGDRSLADEVHGTARWKKVDITATESVFLDHGNIDVSGKGYPGAYWAWSKGGIGNVTNGCTGDTTGNLVGADGILQHDDDPGHQAKNYGFGPGGGIAYRGNNDSSGGGGSFAGQGKLGFGSTWDAPIDQKGSTIYNPAVGNGHLEWGSGGGASAHDGGEDDTSCANGGAGGGIIDITTSKIIKHGVNFGFYADGEIGYMFQNDSNGVGSGGGSGGAIRINVNKITEDGAGTTFASDGGVNGGGRGRSVQSDPNLTSGPVNLDFGTWFNTKKENAVSVAFSVKGGDRSLCNRGKRGSCPHDWYPDDGAGGGGGWVILGDFVIPLPPPPQQGKVKVIVTWEELGEVQTVEMDTWLRDVRVQ